MGMRLKKLPAKAVQRLKTFWPHLIEAILQSDKPQVALLRLMPLVESVHAPYGLFGDAD